MTHTVTPLTPHNWRVEVGEGDADINRPYCDMELYVVLGTRTVRCSSLVDAIEIAAEHAAADDDRIQAGRER